jgi:L-threonylcarbamoyladenylate synthase
MTRADTTRDMSGGQTPGTTDVPRGQTPAMAEGAVAALLAGQLVVLPTDTVYGLCANAYREEPYRRLCRLKGRPETTPTALLAADLDAILDAVPEARGRAAVVARELLPGPYTLVLPNPARRFRWLCGETPEKIGVRVPELPPSSRGVVQRIGAVVATSANLHGGRDPARIADVPEEILAEVAAALDAGELPGRPSTVVDLTALEPRVLREGAVPAAEALARAGGTGIRD